MTIIEQFNNPFQQRHFNIKVACSGVVEEHQFLIQENGHHLFIFYNIVVAAIKIDETLTLDILLYNLYKKLEREFQEMGYTIIYN